MNPSNGSPVDRRTFVKQSVAAGVGLGLMGGAKPALARRGLRPPEVPDADSHRLAHNRQYGRSRLATEVAHMCRYGRVQAVPPTADDPV